jgi:magnesium transporter
VTGGGYEVTQVDQPTKEQFYEALAAAGLTWPHEDILEHHSHPGLRAIDGTLALILQPVFFDEHTDSIEVVQSAAVLGTEHGVIARWKEDCLDEAFETAPGTREDLICALVETVYDADTAALAALEERVDECELEVLDADGHGTSAQAIYHLEHELTAVRRSVAPMVSVLDRLGRKAGAEGKLAVDEWRDRYLRLVSQVEDIDNLLSSVLSVNLTLVSVRQNEDMRKIAAWGAIGIAPTALAGIWGMNFEHMPELASKFGYPSALATIALVCGGLYWFFKRKGWL